MLTGNQKKRINVWMNEVIRKGKWQDYDDLHIDRINPWIKKKPSKWINKSLEYFEFANSLVKQKGDFRVLLVIGLASRRKLRDTVKLDLDTLSFSKLSNSPPALYIYINNHYLGRRINASVKKHHVRYKDFLYYLYQAKDQYDGRYINCIHILVP
ncbi:MAG: hypothetical protein A2047_03775 [Omnitrophica bacterium GWA2_41_15]|nr:MAG: hypothetical protein A2047_03775 [Omnitrophica bacterium GWA2_41_15]